jgi:hypothetical protein
MTSCTAWMHGVAVQFASTHGQVDTSTQQCVELLYLQGEQQIDSEHIVQGCT